jgi:nickel/cobalt transporter (NiCoT) family protein
MATRRPRWTSGMTAGEWRRLGAFGAGVLALHVLGIGLLAWYAARYPVLTGLAWTAYLLGLRHAFDADHIAAIDNTTRRLMRDGGRPLGVGFFFSLGHSTVVFALTAALAVATRTVDARMPGLERYGSIVGASVSGTFLWLIGILNLLVLIDILRIARGTKRHGYDERELDARLLARGLMNRCFGRFVGLIRSSWHMYPLGLLFGIGFDTASEVGLLALSAGAARTVPVAALIALPILFAAGMSLMDTADGAFMSHAYGWAFSNPVRKLYYNLTVTSMSVAIALLVGTVELLQVAAQRLGLSGGFWEALAGLDFETAGYGIVALFLVMWAGSYAIWRLRHIEQRWGATPAGD